MYNPLKSEKLFVWLFLLATIFLVFLHLNSIWLHNKETKDSRIPRYSAVDASFDSRRPLVVPMTIVTAASGNHACSLEAFLYHLNATLSLLSTSPTADLLRIQERNRLGQSYLDTSPDMDDIRKKTKKTPKKTPVSKGDVPLNHEADAAAEVRVDDSKEVAEVVYEVRPKVIVYNLGMGPSKTKKRKFKALIEAGYMDEAIDFDFKKYPEFWKLGTETRGEYGWKSGIIEEVSSRVLASEQGFGELSVPKRRRMPQSTKRQDEKDEDDDVHEWAGVEEQVDEGSSSPEDESALHEYEGEEDVQQVTAKQTSHEQGIVLWLDSGDRVTLAFLRWLPSFLRRHGLWTAQSQDDMRTWTHPGMLGYYHDTLDRFTANETNCNAAAIAFDIRNTTVRNGIMKKWVQCARVKECIAPEGSSRENHRQDQAALTYLVKTMGYGEELCHGFPESFGVQVNQDKYCKLDISLNRHRVVST